MLTIQNSAKVVYAATKVVCAAANVVCAAAKVVSVAARVVCAATLVMCAAALLSQGANAQAAQSPNREYENLQAMIAALPAVAPPVLDETSALWLAAFPLACLDRLQARPGRAPQTTVPRADSVRADSMRVDSMRADSLRADTMRPDSLRPDSTRRDSAAAAPPPRAAPNSGADYFWVATYRLIPRHNRTRAFWGCTDWHSAASSTWVTAALLKKYPRSPLQELGREKLAAHLGATNLQGELDFFRTAAGTFERPYGYAWLLKLQSTLRTWPDSQARRFARNATPLANWMADSLMAYVNALPRPVRAGTLNNTALVLTLALDYAEATANAPLRSAITRAAHRFYGSDRDCNTQAEAAAAGNSGRTATRDSTGRLAPLQNSNDVLSPCLSASALMARVLDRASFTAWLNGALPAFHSQRFAPLTDAPGASAAGSDRARLAGLAFQRAYAMERIAQALVPTDARVIVLRRLAALHADRGMQLLRADTAGGHWVPAYALLYFEVRS